jgi:hypothetical protein
MEKMLNGLPGPHESWQELADHSFEHDDLPSELGLPMCQRCGVYPARQGRLLCLHCARAGG